MTMTYTCTAYGLVLRLPFSCPALTPAPEDAIPDVIVLNGVVPRYLAAPAAEGINWQAEPGRFLHRGGMRAGRFLVEGGERVTLERNLAAEDEMLCFHFLSAVLAAVLRQRGLLVLHANAAATPAGAVAMSGASGAGKSTTLAALLARGCAMLADDIVVLQKGQGGHVEVLPGVPQLHLTEESANAVGQDITGLPRYPWRRMKAAVPAHNSMATDAASLRALYLLQTYGGAELRVQLLTGAEKFAALQDCVYGPLLADEHPGLFPLFTAVAEQVPVWRLERPAERWSLNYVAEVILNG